MRPVRVLVALLAVVVVAAACTNDESAYDTGPIAVDVAVQPAIAAQIPADIRAGGVLIVGNTGPYQPLEFKNRRGEIIGFDIDLLNALGKVVGLRPRVVEAEFAKIIPAIQAGTFHAGIAAFTDTVERQRQVDFVDYFSAGVQWARRSGDTITPETACGRRVGVKATTVQDTQDVPAKSRACESAGRPAIRKIKFTGQDEVVNALLLGQVDAFAADSPVTAYAVRKTDGQLESVGPVYASAPYGIPVPQGSTLGPALRDALQFLIDHGHYATIARHWGMDAGMITAAVINGAKE
ncbi:MAG: ABC transporter substrate-binding protein [Gordonia sp. (in: high G+C Gram-positive bacteria)]|uniref:ABC transporter substrate-binding protein n=1 Tax=Gordonia sp. (in: high G+C Gram-positive bacteria) TaxID=84139 RepID=UPI0039E5A0EE